MQTLYSFEGTKTLSIVEREEYGNIKEQLYDNDAFLLPIISVRDLDDAIRHKCTIYCKEINGNSRYFIRLPKETAFCYAR